MRGPVKSALLALLLLGGRAQAAGSTAFGGDVRVGVPGSALDLERTDPALARSPQEQFVARQRCAPLLSLSESGELIDGWAARIEQDPKGRSFSLLLPEGARFAGGTALRAKEVVASLGRLSAPDSPWRPIALAFTRGHGSIEARGERRVVLRTQAARPELATAFATLAGCVSSAPGAKGFTATTSGLAPDSKLAPPAVRFSAAVESPVGRAFVDRLVLKALVPRAAAKAVAAGEVDASLVPLSEAPSLEGPALHGTFLTARAEFAPLVALLKGQLDRPRLAESCLRGRAQTTDALLPPSLVAPRGAGSAPAPNGPAPRRAALAFDAASEAHRCLAERLQVRLHDLGVEVQLQPLPRSALFEKQGRGEVELALVAMPFAPEPLLALSQLLGLVRSDDALLGQVEALAALDGPARAAGIDAAVEGLRSESRLLPLAWEAPALWSRAPTGWRFDGAGLLDLSAVEAPGRSP